MKTIEELYSKILTEGSNPTNNPGAEDQQAIAELLKQQITKSAPEFVSIEYTNSSGERSRQVINVGVSYIRVLEKSLNDLNSLDLDAIKADAQSKGISPEFIDQAVSAIETSISSSMNRPEQTDVSDISNYTKLSNGIKIHNTTGDLYLNGLVRSKTVITPGTYKEVKSRPLTLAKKMIEKHLTMSKYRMFKLTPNQIHSASSEGKTLVIQ